MEKKIKVSSFRRIPNPYKDFEPDATNGNQKAEMYIAICDVKELPNDFWMETNPREQNLSTRLAKNIRESLLDESSLDFYLLNRGLLLSAEQVTFNNYNNEMTVVFNDDNFHGNVDGGHTYKIILENRDQLKENEQFVKLEILTGIEDIFQNLAEARNKSNQVKEKSLAELRKQFDIIKKGVGGEPYEQEIIYAENKEGRIDITDMIAILNMFDLEKYPGVNSLPIVSYSSKNKCLESYLEYFEKRGDGICNPYMKMLPVMKDIFKLYDYLETNIAEYYQNENAKGRYGRTKGVVSKPIKSKFYGNDISYFSPTGFLYPILGALRAVLEENETGEYKWKEDPFVVLDRIGGKLVDTTVDRSRTLGGNPNAVGKDKGNWNTLYMNVAFTLMDLN